MTLLQYAAILALLGISIIKPFLYRPLAEKYPANFAPEFTVAWIMPFILLSLPFMYPYLIDAVPTIKAHPTSFVLTVLKGVLIWYAYKYAMRKSLTMTVLLLPCFFHLYHWRRHHLPLTCFSMKIWRRYICFLS